MNMATLEIPIDPELIAKRGYTALLNTHDVWKRIGEPVKWINATAETRNQWRAWAREFIRLNMGIGS